MSGSGRVTVSSKLTDRFRGGCHIIFKLGYDKDRKTRTWTNLYHQRQD